jgi:glycosyltransferase involved in cell wall biosynthesis
LVDEIVVVDTGSIDHTKLIAKSVGAKVFDFPWCNDFAKARNESLDHCTSDWVLVLDADEAIDSSDHAKILKSINSDYDALNIPIWNYLPTKDMLFMDKTIHDNPNFGKEIIGGCYEFYGVHNAIRLFRNIKGVYSGHIHETVDDYFLAHKLRIGETDAVIHHAGKMLFEKEIAKSAFYLDLALKESELNPSTRSWYNVAQQALIAGEPQIVMKAVKSYLQLSGGEAPAVIYLAAGMALRDLGRVEDSIVCFDAILKTEGNPVAQKQKEISLSKK